MGSTGDKSKGVYYGDYLKLDRLLGAQLPVSKKPAHDELLFIITHQAYELWFKQILFEIDSVRELFKTPAVHEDQMGTAVHLLERVNEILKLLVDQVDILETMTAMDFLDFRDELVPASGFQSLQFRMLEWKLGITNQLRPAHLSRLNPSDRALLEKIGNEPTLLSLIEKWLERIPFLNLKNFDFWSQYRKAVDAMLTRDMNIIQNNKTLTHDERAREMEELQRTGASFASVLDEKKHAEFLKDGTRRLSYKATQAALFIYLYRDQPVLHLPFRLLQAAITIDEHLTSWRHKHVLMVHRMIGMKIGTGGSSGHQYLKSSMEMSKVFADLFNISTYLVPRSELPQLPPDITRTLGFAYNANS